MTSDGALDDLRRRLVPYWLLGPGRSGSSLFFVVPMYFMGELSLRSGSLNTGFTSRSSSNYSDALSGNTEQLVRSFFYAGAATLIALLIAYPLAYAIALKRRPLASCCCCSRWSRPSSPPT